MNGKKKDLCIIVVFLLIAAFSIDMFRYDFLRTINLLNVKPVGTVVIKKNTVQRRIADRALWDRLAKESPVYIGDIIRVAEVSAATLYIDDNCIDLDENTLIRITRAADGKTLQIVLGEGSISLASGAESGNISFEFNGIQVHARPGTVLSASSSKTGDVSVQVNEGNAQIVEKGGTTREISLGSLIIVDADGTEKQERTAVVTSPLPNTRYVNSAKEPMTINFSWNRINLAPAEKLRMEISSDRNFSRISSVIQNLDMQAQAQFDTGAWYWRLLFDNTVLTTGRLTIADGSGPPLQSPAFNSLFRYRDKPPILNFQWAEVQEADSYIIEVSNTHDFSNPKIRSLTSAISMTVSAPGDGSWFWRVTPVFPSIFGGSAVSSTASFFRIQQAIPVSSARTANEANIEQNSAALAENAQEISMSQWLAAAAPSQELPPDLPPEIIPPNLIKPPESEPPPSTASRLSAPQNLSPERGTVFGLEDFRTQRSIVFNWSAVRGANAYIFTLYQRTARSRRQIVRQTIKNGTSYSLTNLRLLDRGTFIWQVEAVSIGRANIIVRRGATGENTFIIDFPSSAPLQIENEEILYDN